MQELRILDVGDLPDGTPVVVLSGDDLILLIRVDLLMATVISRKMRGVNAGRPMTHDLIVNLLVGLGATIDRVEITEMRDGIYLGYLVISVRNIDDKITGVVRIDCRPSDGIAMSLHVGCPIKVANKVIAEYGVAREEVDFVDLDSNID